MLRFAILEEKGAPQWENFWKIANFGILTNMWKYLQMPKAEPEHSKTYMFQKLHEELHSKTSTIICPYLGNWDKIT